MEGGRGEINVARRQGLSSEGKPESPNLRDFLRIKQDDNSSKDRNGGEVLRSNSNRTLIDIIREDPYGGGNGKKHWRHFREKLRLRRVGSGNSWISSVPVPASDVPLQPSGSSRNFMMMRRDSTRMNTPSSEGSGNNLPDVDLSTGVPRSRSALIQRNESRAIRRVTGELEEGVHDVEADRDRPEGGTEEEEEREGETAGEGGGGGAQPERMSLMALLAETDKQMGLESSYMMDEDDEDEEEDSGVGYNNCCVCMVRHKGAAFIPCGHTFCRLCSRELWIQRGNCPLCNNFILEILDIF